MGIFRETATPPVMPISGVCACAAATARTKQTSKFRYTRFLSINHALEDRRGHTALCDGKRHLVPYRRLQRRLSVNLVDPDFAGGQTGVAYGERNAA